MAQRKSEDDTAVPGSSTSMKAREGSVFNIITGMVFFIGGIGLCLSGHFSGTHILDDPVQWHASTASSTIGMAMAASGLLLVGLGIYLRTRFRK